MLLFIRKLCKVSVPIQGTYLPFENVKVDTKILVNFRPHSGDLSSIRKRSDRKRNRTKVSVPIQGTYLPFFDKGLVCRGKKYSFRPHSGDLSSILFNNSHNFILHVSVPIQGTYLPFGWDSLNGFLSQFPSPFRGLIFHSKSMQMLVKRQ